LRAFGVIGAAAALLLGGAAQAQSGGSDRLVLLCSGSDTVLMAVTPYNELGRTPYYGAMYFGEGRTTAQLGVTVEGGRVRVKPPKGSIPILAKETKDGWYDLTDVAVDPLTIKGRIKWNRIDRSRLNVDRRTGAATFGSFTGVCQKASSDPDATKF
jgi:hypothetical protein